VYVEGIEIQLTMKSVSWLRYLRECVESMGLKGNVIFAGYLSETDLRVAYAMCDVFILPSVREGQLPALR
jgi:glycosyltransferase involved in cell wall biosynthesis